MENSYEKNKRIAKNTLLLYIRMFLMMGVSIYTSRIVLNTLGIEDYGLYNVVAGFISLFAFLNGAMSAATQRFLNFEIGQQNSKRLQSVFITSTNIHICISIIVLIISETFGLWFLYNYLSIPTERLNAVVWVYQFSILSTIVLIMSVPYNACIIAHEKMSAFAYISILEICSKLAIVYILPLTEIDRLKLYAILMFIIQLIIRFIYGIYCKKNFKETHYKVEFNKKLFYEMCTFASWNLFGTIAAIGFTQGVNVLLNIFFGPSINAARGIAVQVQNAIKNFSTNFQTAINPQITKTYAENNLDYMHSLIFTSSRISVYLLLLLSLPIIIETEQILLWWLNVVPEYTAIFIKLILIISIIDSLASPIIQGALATGHIKKFQTIIGSILLSIVPFSYLALKINSSPLWPFIIHLIITIVCLYIRLKIISPQIKMKSKEYYYKVIVPIIKVSVTCAIIPISIHYALPSSPLRVICVFITSILFTSISTYFLGMNRYEKKFLLGKIKQSLIATKQMLSK